MLLVLGRGRSLDDELERSLRVEHAYVNDLVHSVSFRWFLGKLAELQAREARRALSRECVSREFDAGVVDGVSKAIRLIELESDRITGEMRNYGNS